MAAAVMAALAALAASKKSSRKSDYLDLDTHLNRVKKEKPKGKKSSTMTPAGYPGELAPPKRMDEIMDLAEQQIAKEFDDVRAAASRPTHYVLANRTIVVYPISNSLPDELFEKEVPQKLRSFAENIPDNKSTYIFHDEASYLAHYRRAYFGVTRRKAGWDSARHLEIMASGCVPFFLDMALLPSPALSFYPHGRIAAAMSLPGVRPVLYQRDWSSLSTRVNPVPHNSPDRRWYLQPDSFSVEVEPFFNASTQDHYLQLAAAILVHARTHLSSSAMARHVLRTMGFEGQKPSAATPLLFITHCSEDFTGDSLLHGLQTILGPKNVVDVAFDTDGIKHVWCTEESRTTRRKPSLYEGPAGAVGGRSNLLEKMAARRGEGHSSEDLSELKAAGFNARALLAAGYKVAELKAAGYTLDELKATSGSSGEGQGEEEEVAEEGTSSGEDDDGDDDNTTTTTKKNFTRFSLYGRLVDDPAIDRTRLEERVASKEFGAVIFGSASRTMGGLYQLVAKRYEKSRVAFIYGEDQPYPLALGWPIEGIQRPGKHATLPSTAEASKVGTIFQREIYDAPGATWKTQTLSAPGLADAAERRVYERYQVPTDNPPRIVVGGHAAELAFQEKADVLQYSVVHS